MSATRYYKRFATAKLVYIFDNNFLFENLSNFEANFSSNLLGFTYSSISGMIGIYVSIETNSVT